MECFLVQHPSVPRFYVNTRYQPSLAASRSTNLRFNSHSCLATKFNGLENGDLLEDGPAGSLLGVPYGPAKSAPSTSKAEIAQETTDFFVSDIDGDPDCPKEGFSSINQALDMLRQGQFVIAVNDENEDLGGNLIMAASLASTAAVSFMLKHGSGIISVGMKAEDLERLNLPLMVTSSKHTDSITPAYTISVDVKVGASPRLLAENRAKTIVALSSSHSKPEDFTRPGHVFPIMYRNGGVLNNADHAEASVDLISLAGLPSMSVLSAIVDAKDGSIAPLSYIRKMALECGVPIVTITDLIRYRRKREKLVDRIGVTRLPTKWGQFEAYCYRSKLDGTEYMAILKGSIGTGQDILVRLHSECFTGDIFGSARCDCGNQLALAMKLIEQAGRGVVVYLRGHEGRGIGLGNKLQAYNLQDQGYDTVEANLKLGFAADARDYTIGAQILRDMGVHTMRLMTNNPAKFTGLKGNGLSIVGRVPILSPITKENKRYIETKLTKMGHLYGSNLHGAVAGFPDLTVNISEKGGHGHGSQSRQTWI